MGCPDRDGGFVFKFPRASDHSSCCTAQKCSRAQFGVQRGEYRFRRFRVMRGNKKHDKVRGLLAQGFRDFRASGGNGAGAVGVVGSGGGNFHRSSVSTSPVPLAQSRAWILWRRTLTFLRLNSDPHPDRWKKIAAFAAIYLIWGSTYLAIRVGVESFSPALFASARFLACAPLMLGCALLFGGSVRATRQELFHAAIVGLALFVGGNYLLVWAEQYVASGLASLIVAGVPIWMTGIEHFRRAGERVGVLGWSGIALGFLGVVLLVDPGTYSGTPSDGRTGTALLAELAIVISSILWSAGSIYSKHAPLPKDAFASTGYQTFFGGLALAGIAAWQGEWAAFSFEAIPPRAWWSFAYLVVFGSLIGLTSYVWLIRHAPAAQVSTYAYVNPIVAVALGFFILDEPIGMRTLIGMTVILGGVALVSQAKWRGGEAK